MAEEKTVRYPANLWLISPKTLLKELLLYEVRMSITYFTAFSMSCLIFFFRYSSYDPLTLSPCPFRKVTYR